MKQALLLSVLSIALFTSCSTAFKAGQTPDDVYYSPGREVPSAKEEEVQKKQVDEYQSYVSNLDDRYLRMKVANRYRWGSLDNFDYWYDSRYDFSNSHYYYNEFNPYTNWNPVWGGRYGRLNPWTGNDLLWGNPIYTLVLYAHPSYSPGSTSASNITAYRNKTYSNNNYGYKDPKTGVFVPNNNNNSFGNLLKKVFSPATSTSNASSYDRPVRTFTTPTTNNPAPATSSSAGGSSGGFPSTGTSTSTGRGGRG